MKVGDLLAMTAMTLLDDSRNWGHFWKIESIHGTYQYPTDAILNLLCVKQLQAVPYGSTKTKTKTNLCFCFCKMTLLTGQNLTKTKMSFL
jgi:hypothetical protein